jgi:hypothetical protein
VPVSVLHAASSLKRAHKRAVLELRRFVRLSVLCMLKRTLISPEMQNPYFDMKTLKTKSLTHTKHP